MNISLKKKEIVACILSCILGVLFHFVYNWSNQSFFLGFFVPVNESIWEHLKLHFYPIILVSIPQYYLLGKQYPDFFCVKFRSILLAIFSTVILFYTYSGILGQIVDFINIAIFFLSMILAYLYSCKQLQKQAPAKSSGYCILGLFTLALLFAVFTIYPPAIGLFQVP